MSTTTQREVNRKSRDFWAHVTYDREGRAQLTPAAQRTLDRAHKPLEEFYELPEASRVVAIEYAPDYYDHCPED
jgi:hypothetical protein